MSTIEELAEKEKSLLADIESTGKEIQDALDRGDWTAAAALREKKAHLSGPGLSKLKAEQAEAELAAKKAVIAGLRKQAAGLRSQITNRDKRTADARALIEKEEEVSFDWLARDPTEAAITLKHWTCRFKPMPDEIPFHNPESVLSASERDLQRIEGLERDAARLEKQLSKG